MPSGGAEFARVDLEIDLFRLIPSRFPPVEVYEGIVANDRVEDLVRIEIRTNPRLRSESKLMQATSEAPPPKLQNWNLAPFKYLNPEGTRFFGPARPALELAEDRQTALAVSVARRQRFLARTGEPPIGLDMRMLKTPVRGQFLDLRHVAADAGQDDRRRIGDMISDGVDGVLYHPPERPSAMCVAVLRGETLGRSVQTVHYRFVWNGSSVHTLYAFDGEGKKIPAETLGLAVDALAA